MLTPGSGARKRVLIVDDQEIVARSLALIVKSDGFEVREVHSGKAALECAASFRPDGALLDVMMPHMDGIETGVRLRACQPQCRILMLSGDPMAAMLLRARSNELNTEILEKPVPPRVLLDKLEALLGVSRRRLPRVLNVDDNEIHRYLLNRVLTEAGFDVQQAATGQEGLALAQTGPDLILLDVHLPDLDGFEVCRRIKSAAVTSAIPVVHLTATFPDAKYKALALSVGAQEYLTLPIDAQALVATLNRLLRPQALTGGA